MSTYAAGPMIYVTFTSNSTTGAISVSGLKVNDVVLTVGDVANSNDLYGNGAFETFVSTADQIFQKWDTDLSAKTLFAVLYRP